ncbi:MAG TPA: hypothetical protein VFW00_14010, partial [Rhodocyclaceae bacterium]|nr:hypothetical protein [Rhodocyclaceae bacterium]
MNMLQSWPRMLLALPALAALVCGMLSGLARLGFALPAPVGHLAGVHGALMVGGFLGTLIGLERAVALGRRWAYLAPALSGLAALAMIANAPNTLAPLLMSVAALFMLFACTSVWLRQRAVHHAVLGIAALAWLLGDLVWAWQGSVSPAVLFWAAFLTLTIAGERLELSRFVPTSKNAKGIICIIVTVMMDGAIYSLFNATAGSRTFALALLALALWLLRYDIARRTIRMHGLTRYMAICLLSGYAWTAVAALLGLTGAFATGHPLHDAALHALLLGFVFSMVFAHAPVIL